MILRYAFPLAFRTGDSLGVWLWRFAALAGGTVWRALHWSPMSLPDAGAAVVAAAAVYGLSVLPSLIRSPLRKSLGPCSGFSRQGSWLFQVRTSA